ncbi:helix-turn-helix domain-containing protein [Leptolyngbya sp. FACHB-321]|uniref:helix-turn-helix domain-containing protein n=1 Tax=Leptolyngbya sp. FACHB-321 TaxID=2692807 RepID=UPI0016861EA8|nr:helix-turn-helix domain-containing protein [Leptolyngbya sp. FACHB-321]MBD2038969.1 helix-turn-helix domain-containing protein [Leptolyngbya sp. FACHB-321]
MNWIYTKKSIANHQLETAGQPILSSQKHGWENILVEQFQHPPGEANCHYSDEHTICLSLASRPVRFLQVREGKTYSGLYGKGDISITPAKTPFFARWDSEDHYLQIRLAAHFIQRIAQEILDQNLEHLELLPEFRTRDPQIEAIGMMLLNELQQENLGGKLYIESLTNVLAVRILRQYATTEARLPTYKSGLPERQLLQVLEYINEHLDEDIRLSSLAQLLGMSQFHFSHVFKQSIGTAPYQYLLQQRVERAKQLLKQTDQSVMEIALLCGFNSHSHLSKQFRQLTGVTPTAYRTN